MATLPELVEMRYLCRWTGSLRRRQQPLRSLYLFPETISDFRTACRRKPHTRGLLSPEEQLDGRLENFVGKADPPTREVEIKMISSDAEGLYEFRTVDSRLVGWFCHRDVFIGVEAFLKGDLSRIGGMKAVKERVFQARTDLDLDAPKHIGGSYDDVLG